MSEKEMSTKKVVIWEDVSRIVDLERWFRTTYVERKMKITRYNYLKIPLEDDNLYSLEVEAYSKEQLLRKLKGLEPLPEIKIGGIF